MADAPPLSLCMIVKNEAACLGRCLTSVRDLVDEMVIVDTGSTDDTVAIAKSFGARVLHEPWTDDYSAPRNMSLAAATGHWLLVLDADEVLSPQDHGAIRDAMTDARVTGFRMRTRNYVADLSMADAVQNPDPPPEGEGFPAWVPSDKVRLFRGVPHVRFRGAIHEVVDASIREGGGRIEFLDVPVHHYGFVEQQDTDGSKLAMQRRVAERKVADAPDDFKAHYELAVILHSGGEFAEARVVLDRSLQLKDDWALSQYELGFVCERLEDWAEAIAAYHRTLALDPTHLSAGLNLGVLALRAGRQDEAERVLRAVTEHHPRDARGWNNLGAVFGHVGRDAEAEAVWREALRVDPANAEARQNLDRLAERAAAGPTGPRVSLCMIVRDEEANLHAAVAPLVPLVHEIVIVDTGSTDGTVALAESLGAQVVDFPWCDDFAAARNAGLERATGDWIVWLDADDRLPETSLSALASALRQPPDHAVQWCIESQSGAREPVRFLQLRQFPRRADVRWTGRIHEEVTSAVRAAGLPIDAAENVVVVHTGYRDEVTLQRKHERNVRLLELAREDTPDSATVWHHLSQMYALLGRRDEAVAACERLLAMEPLDGDERYFGLQARVRLAQLAVRDEDTARATEVLTGALAIVPHYPPAEYLLGELLWQAGDVQAATPYLHNVARAHMPLSDIPLPMPALRAGALNILGRIAQSAGQPAQALAFFEQALEESPHVAVIHANQADALLALGRGPDAQRAARRARELAPDDLQIAQRTQAALASADATADPEVLLSLCMIVRDEAENLRQLLPQVADVVDELVVVDTGSVDDTVAVAEAHGARVLHTEWADDFAAARNTGLAESRGRWVLWLDADDRVEPAPLAGLRRVLAGMPPQAVRLPVCSTLAGGGVTALSLRVFPAGHGVRWQGRVHEDLVESCHAAALPIVDCFDLVIQHLGYADPKTLARKLHRNRRLLELQLAEHPDDVRLELQLAQNERALDDRAAADARLVRLLSSGLTDALRAQALAFRTSLAEETGQPQAWLELARAWYEQAPDDAAARVSYAHALTHVEQWAEALAVLEGILTDTVRPGAVPVNLEALERRRRYLLGLCYRHAGRQGDALRELAAVLHASPEDPDALFETANVNWDAGQFAAADAGYARVLDAHPHYVPALVQRGNIAFNQQRFDAADTFYTAALDVDPSFRPAQENACAVAMARDDRPTARARLDTALAAYPDAANLRVYLADLQFAEAEYGPALDSYRRFLTEQPDDVKALTRLGDCLRLLGHPAEAGRAYDVALHLDPAFTGARQGHAALAGTA